MRLAIAFSLLMLGATPTVASATTPTPPPEKLSRDFSFGCRMLAEDAVPSDLTINIRHEELAAGEAVARHTYWWSLSGDRARFPVNETFQNMRSIEFGAPQSGLSFVAEDGWRYVYQLYYGVAEEYPRRVFVPDHLLVRKRLESDPQGAWSLVAIGQCALVDAKEIS